MRPVVQSIINRSEIYRWIVLSWHRWKNEGKKKKKRRIGLVLLTGVALLVTNKHTRCNEGRKFQVIIKYIAFKDLIATPDDETDAIKKITFLLFSDAIAIFATSSQWKSLRIVRDSLRFIIHLNLRGEVPLPRSGGKFFFKESFQGTRFAPSVLLYDVLRYSV